MYLKPFGVAYVARKGFQMLQEVKTMVSIMLWQ